MSGCVGGKDTKGRSKTNVEEKKKGKGGLQVEGEGGEREHDEPQKNRPEPLGRIHGAIFGIKGAADHQGGKHDEANREGGIEPRPLNPPVLDRGSDQHDEKKSSHGSGKPLEMTSVDELHIEARKPVGAGCEK